MSKSFLLGKTRQHQKYVMIAIRECEHYIKNLLRTIGNNITLELRHDLSSGIILSTTAKSWMMYGEDRETDMNSNIIQQNSLSLDPVSFLMLQ